MCPNCSPTSCPYHRQLGWIAVSEELEGCGDTQGWKDAQEDAWCEMSQGWIEIARTLSPAVSRAAYPHLFC